MRRLAIGIMMLVASAHVASALTSVAVADLPADDIARDGRAGASAQAIVVTAPAVPASVAERAPSGNPLWSIPFSALSGTRDRPIFSASRRPIPPAVAPVAAVAVFKPTEPERPQLSLVGTIAGGDEGFGIFLDESTKSGLRLKVGEDYQGWKLRSVQGREATLEKDQQVVTLALPQSGAGRMETPVEHRQPAANAGKVLSVSSRPRPDDRSAR